MKLLKTELHKIGQSGGFLGILFSSEIVWIWSYFEFNFAYNDINNFE